MRDLSTEELQHVYGAGNQHCPPPKHKCDNGKSKSKSKSRSRSHHGSKSRSHGHHGGKSCK